MSKFNFWLAAFFINWLVNILALEFLSLRKLKSVIKVDEERDGKYPAFRRNDTQWFTRSWLFMTCPLSIFRVSIAILSLIICGLLDVIIVKLTRTESLTRYKIMRVFHFLTSCCVLFGSSVLWVSFK
mmetsp:Transcript_6823/g.11508  ORF Transcript_6823/g.11508 Transcript_6823/m.11508 type:complete len:127 (+) Transcript_6823:56-436(+)